MSKPIANYTTTIDANKTVGEIISLLARTGCTSLNVQYEKGNGSPTGVSFVAMTRFGEQEFQLPICVDGVFGVLSKQSSEGTVPRRFATREQAERVAWRIARDWLENQLSLIEAKMMTIEEAMLGQMLEAPGRTVLDVMAERRLALPAGKARRQADEPAGGH